ncbi:glycosyltransferase involved in cell wall biosynthesis [Lewinella aquimaris]|uniref:Glycosyltransferase involved in cell wall biosynthesis n=2 Tax=Neolewinella aquimaris TaxID=1835722 RepID=A0A840E977_9BACT|nr:glycosyltransferase [Neolewinella aquimaris]MBB4080493.1 glycosyltransferase involved in cell wall biosynthesis [Neolewinella aquimaris]
MPLYNGRPYVVAAIESVLQQRFMDWELLVIDDGSTDGGPELVRTTFVDPRIRLLANPNNRGVAYTRNVGIAAARGEFLAWLDCDDLITPDRLQAQLDYLHEHPELGACGSWIQRFGSGKEVSTQLPKSPEIIRGLLLFTPIVPNATVMLRLKLVEKLGLRYDESLPIAEDYDFVLRCSQHFPIGIIPRILYRYRVTENSLTQRLDTEEEAAFAISKVVHGRALERFGMQVNEEELRTHRILNSDLLFATFSQYRAALSWLLLLLRHNEKHKIYDPAAFRRVGANRFYFISKKASSFGIRTLIFYVRNAVAHNLLYLSPAPLAKFVFRCLIRYDKF